MELTEELCEVIGAYMGDGCIWRSKNNHYKIQYTGDSRLDREYYERVIGPAVNKIFKVKTDIRDVKGKNAIRINFYSKDFYYFLKELFNLKSNKKTHIIKIPNEILESKNKALLHSIIRGLFDTDGGVFLDKRKMYKTP